MGFVKIKDLINEERPREKLAKCGVKVLTDPELLSIILRSGGKETSATDLSRELLTNFGGLSKLVNAEIEQLISFQNIGIAKATSIKAAFEIGLRTTSKNLKAKSEVKKPEDVYWLLRKDLFERSEEHLYLVSLNTRNKVVSKDLISFGSINETIVSPREIYKKALSKNAVSIILAHNHPSNDTQPSVDDIRVTERVAKVGREIGIPLIDHVIIGNDSFTSMKTLSLFKSRKFT